ncbi:uncharacterized protein LACBIDRAFT_302318 [Laccaria bicolor S238N-H82]|uniref:Predicted protein n=1 Tax=Laccaria bicolor (strain S238N-H82 / ATCC MYA-4686) TaxID=486041 RepID=B0DHJ0_LACBS|nr:uncharacterized protein LACBIDRAFT_302318 [Laccaria bicolor S238N-H82]EDR06115.1 predicted protein [Laccaria bicolor S238N-H82]|eukprot:XP_001883403.1 predicted protein [Laccaria bicolor S238N-H82]
MISNVTSFGRLTNRHRSLLVFAQSLSSRPVCMLQNVRFMHLLRKATKSGLWMYPQTVSSSSW